MGTIDLKMGTTDLKISGGSGPSDGEGWGEGGRSFRPEIRGMPGLKGKKTFLVPSGLSLGWGGVGPDPPGSARDPIPRSAFEIINP